MAATEAPTEAATEVPHEASDEVPDEAPGEAPDEVPGEVSDEGLGEAEGEGTAEGEGHEEEEAGEESEHEHVGDAVKTTSYLLIGFMVANSMLLWLVNWPDANVRSYAWKMISGTISIYLAVILNTSIVSGLLAIAFRNIQVEESKVVSIASIIILAALFLISFTSVNVLCHRFREQPKWLYATQIIGGHITAFAGIGTFKSLMRQRIGSTFLWISLFASWVVMHIATATAHHVRRKLFGPGEEPEEEDKLLELENVCPLVALFYKNGEQPGRPTEPQRAKATEGEVEPWREAVCEAEDEACSIIGSFMIKVMLMYMMFGAGQEELLKRHKFTVHQFWQLFMASGCLMIILILMTCWRSRLDKSSKPLMPTSRYMRWLNSTQATLAMCMSWLALAMFIYGTTVWFPHVGEEFTNIINAAILTVCSLVGIILFDLCADKASERAQLEEKEVKQRESGKERESLQGTKGSAEQQHGLGRFSLRHVQGEAKHGCAVDDSVTALLEALPDVTTVTLSASNLEKAIRTLIESFSLAIGLAWEKAFDAALETVVNSQPTMRANALWSKCALAALSYLLMMPIWLKFIVPMARKPLTHHEELMRKSSEQDKLF